MCQHPACAAETRTRSKDCDVTIEDRMGSRDALPIPFPSFIYGLCSQSFINYSRFTVHRYSKVLIIDPGTGIAASWSSSTGADTLRVKISVPVPVR